MDENKRERGLGLLLKTERERRKWSQKQAGSRVLVVPKGSGPTWPQVAWSRLEQGGFSPVHPDWKRLADFLRMSSGQLHETWASFSRMVGLAKALVAVSPLPKALHGCDRRALALFVGSIVARAFSTVASVGAE